MTTIAYGLLLLVYLGYKSDYLMANIHKMNLLVFGAKLIGVYVLLLIVYTIVTYISCSVKYSRAQKGIQEYYKGLNQMKKMYDNEERRNKRITGRVK